MIEKKLMPLEMDPMALIVDGNTASIDEARRICELHPGERADECRGILDEFEDNGWQDVLGEQLGTERHRASGHQPRASATPVAKPEPPRRIFVYHRVDG
jgi:hypothetical protein